MPLQRVHAKSMAEMPVLESDAPIRVEIVYAQAEDAITRSVSLPLGATVQDALLLAARDAQFNAIDLAAATLGIYGVVAERDRILSDGDRIEIYRPLAEDPKTARRKRARASPAQRTPPGRSPTGS
jgi:putative ubiquitin-RnfH superfamily antitoxin RatB of RatAB toxin-antitoxin module